MIRPELQKWPLADANAGRVQRPFHPVRQGPEVAWAALPAFLLRVARDGFAFAGVAL
jgi:hypothetical protein